MSNKAISTDANGATITTGNIVRHTQFGVGKIDDIRAKHPHSEKYDIVDVRFWRDQANFDDAKGKDNWEGQSSELVKILESNYFVFSPRARVSTPTTHGGRRPGSGAKAKYGPRPNQLKLYLNDDQLRAARRLHRAWLAEEDETRHGKTVQDYVIWLINAADIAAHII